MIGELDLCGGYGKVGEEGYVWVGTHPGSDHPG
jgi:hypothetical protein